MARFGATTAVKTPQVRNITKSFERFLQPALGAREGQREAVEERRLIYIAPCRALERRGATGEVDVDSERGKELEP